MTQTELFKYGIQTENSDIRAHVTVATKSIYVFPTQNGVRAIEEHKATLRFCHAFQEGVSGPTAYGCCMPVEWIDDLRRLSFASWEGWAAFTPNLGTAQKGALAVQCVIAAMKLGHFPFWIKASEDERQEIQVKGTDIVVFCKQRIQVKCDASGGARRDGGTGNLYLQTHERNPLKRH